MSDPKKEQARSLATEGITLYESDHFEEALARFRSAHALHPLPQGLLYMARCQAKLGHLVEASDLYKSLLDAVLPDSASQNARDAQSIAHTEADALAIRIPRLTVTLGTASPGLAVTIDGVAVPLAELRERAMDPGTHAIVARWKADAPAGTGAPGTTYGTQSVVLTEGERMTVTLRGSTAAPPSSAASSSAAPGPSIAPEKPAAVRALPYAALAAGGIALGAGVVLGVTALGKAADFRGLCDPTTRACPPSAWSVRDNANALGDASTATLVAGGALLATGAVMLLLLKTPDSTKVQVGVGPASLHLSGSF